MIWDATGRDTLGAGNRKNSRTIARQDTCATGNSSFVTASSCLKSFASVGNVIVIAVLDSSRRDLARIDDPIRLAIERRHGLEFANVVVRVCGEVGVRVGIRVAVGRGSKEVCCQAYTGGSPCLLTAGRVRSANGTANGLVVTADDARAGRLFAEAAISCAEARGKALRG